MAGRYRIDRPIAAGTMGRVFEGTQISLDRQVAIKILKSSGSLADVRFKKRFCREASIAAQLTHPNIVSVYDYGETEGGDLFMVMELIPGRSLADEMLDIGPFSAVRTMNVAMQVTRALRKAHRQGVVHRDLKPANIIVHVEEDEIDFVKVLDFGLVKTFARDATVSAPYSGDHLTRVGCMVGTAEYVSPEQALGEEVDGRTDIYSLGVMMFQMITGRLPFNGANILEIVNQQIASEVPRIADVAPGISCPEDLERIIRKCMAKVRDDRYPSMDDVLGDLKPLWRVIMDESFGTDNSMAVHERGLRPPPIGLRPETIALAPVSLSDLPEEDVDPSVADPSEARDAVGPVRRTSGKVVVAVGRILPIRVLLLATLVLLLALGLYYWRGLSKDLAPRSPVAPSISADPEPERTTPTPEPRHHTRGYKENPF